MGAPNRLPIVQSTPKPQLRDIETPIYPRKVLLDVSGLDVETFKSWLFRNVLDQVRLDGRLIALRSRRKTGRASWRYSVLDCLKLATMHTLVTQGVRVEIAAQAPAALEGALSARDRDELLRTLPKHAIAFALVDGELELLWFKSESGFSCLFDTPEEALRESGAMAGFLVDWPALVEGVLAELETYDHAA